MVRDDRSSPGYSFIPRAIVGEGGSLREWLLEVFMAWKYLRVQFQQLGSGRFRFSRIYMGRGGGKELYILL